MKKLTAILFCLILACAAVSAPAEAPAETPAEEEIPFTTMQDVVSGDPFLYYSTGYYVALVKKNGVWWRVDAQVDDRYDELYQAANVSENPAEAYQELENYAHSLPVASAEKLSEQPLSEDTLNSYVGKKMKDLLADGFGFDGAQGFTSDESKADGHAIVLRPTDAAGTEYRIPFYLIYTDPGYTDGLVFSMNLGIYAYQFNFSGSEETLREAIENGTWEEMRTVEPGFFSGFSNEVSRSMMEYMNARYFPTEEEVSAIHTVKDVRKYDYIGFYSDNNDVYSLLINGTDRFWLAEAKLDDRYWELYRAFYYGSGDTESAADTFWAYETALPVTVTALEGEHPPIADLSDCAGKTIRELQAEGFRITWFYVTTPDPEKDEYDKVLSLPDADGKETSVHGYFSYDDYNEFCMFDMSLGLYQYTASFDGTVETLEAALENGTFLDLKVQEMNYTGLSDEVFVALGLR